MDTYTKDLIDAVTKIGQFALLLVAAIWAYFRLWREGVLRPRVDFRIDCKFLGPQEGDYLVELLLYANNRGLVVQRFRSFHLRLRAIPANKPLEYWEKYKPRLLFPEKLLDAEVVHDKFGYIFVEPGVEQVISYVTKVPSSTRFVIARAEFKYENFNPHSAERVFEVPQERPAQPAQRPSGRPRGSSRTVRCSRQEPYVAVSWYSIPLAPAAERGVRYWVADWLLVRKPVS